MSRPITAALLADLFTGHKTNFRSGFAGVSSLALQVATKITSSTGTEKYDWLGEWPRIRKWIGDRVVKELTAHGYSIENEDYESTIKVKRKHIEDDQLGIYGPMFQELGRTTAIFPDELVFALLAAGFATKCYDGQPFFDDEHPVADGVASNMQAGAGAAWYLLDTTRALKPLIYQERRAFDLVGLDDPKDPNVFWRAEYVYGVDGRSAAGYGFWQMAFASKAALSAENYEAARSAMGSLKDDEGKPLGIRPNLLVVPPSLEGAGRRLLKSTLVNGGESNEWEGSAELLVVPHLA
jgi:phage major head subunit gpT-like protein